MSLSSFSLLPCTTERVKISALIRPPRLLRKMFVRVNKLDTVPDDNGGKGGWWTVQPGVPDEGRPGRKAKPKRPRGGEGGEKGREGERWVEDSAIQDSHHDGVSGNVLGSLGLQGLVDGV